MTNQEAMAENAKVKSLRDLAYLVMRIVYGVKDGQIVLPERSLNTPRSLIRWAPYFSLQKKPAGTTRSYTLAQIAQLLDRTESRGRNKLKADRDLRIAFAYLEAFERKMLTADNIQEMTQDRDISKREHLRMLQEIRSRF